MAAIDVRRLVKQFGDFTAVKGVSFAVEEGEVFGLLGPNGAGKSTLIRMLTTLLVPTSGTALVNGFDIVADADEVRRSIGVIPQAMTSDLELSVRENLLIYAKLYGVPRARRARVMAELLEAVELTAWADKPVKFLSGGMRRRVEIARGLVHEPRVFFLDEPTTGLDPVSRVAVWEMLQRIKSARSLTVLITTHYMDEADRLCDRIAIVDHGELKALDSPVMLKASIAGRAMLEAGFGAVPDGWEARLAALPGVSRVTRHGSVFRLAAEGGPATTQAVLEASAAAGVPVQSLSVQSTTLDDVFVHYTGRDLRDALQEPAVRRFRVHEALTMARTWAIIERELRRFRRSPTLIVVSLVFPVIQLVVLGYAFGGNVKHLTLGIVDHDHGVPAVRIRELCQAVTANAATFDTVLYAEDGAALTDLRNGRINGVLTIPPDYSRRVLAGAAPRVALVEDNSDNFVTATLAATVGSLVQAVGQPAASGQRVRAQPTLDVVEMYPYVPYIQYLLPGSIVMSIFMMVMIGGGIIFIDDKARGLHEGYLVTPITRFELIAGFNLSGTIKAVIAGVVLMTIGSLIAGIPDPFAPLRLVRLFVVIVVTAFALISLMFLLMVRVTDPLVPRATFGVLNTLLYFPSGAVYPQQGFPAWMQVLAKVDPFTYAVHAFKSLLLKNTGFDAIGFDLLYLLGFSAITMALAIRLFRRTL